MRRPALAGMSTDLVEVFVPGEVLLADVLSEFARTLVTDFPIQAILDRLVDRIVDVLPVTGAGVTLISPATGPRYVAASDESAMRFEELQSELAEGPSLRAYQSGEAVAIPDLREETRFPNFATRALEVGLGAVFTFPLRHGDEQMGALDLYRTSPGPLSASTMDAAQILADVAAAYVLNARARADLRDSSDRARESALHDPLTGLPNRILLLERLEHAVRRGRRSGTMAAVLFVDLDRFKLVNDLYGHSIGDQLLEAVARRLSATVRPGDTLARMSGDEFVVLCEDLVGAASVDSIASRVGAAIAETFVLPSVEVDITASIGIAFSGRGDRLGECILEEADTAMYQAKRKGGARHQIVDLREQRLADQRARLERDLLGAMARQELRTEYQPIVDASDGRIVGVEALLRWAHPTRGVVAPILLLPLAERSGLMTEIGAWVLERSCTDRRQWQARRPTDKLAISVNISAHQLMSSNFVTTVAEVLDRTETDPKLVELEVAESVFVDDSARALVVLTQLQRLGVGLALDDFGTGYSSLKYLRRSPIDTLKIDQGFVADLGEDQASHAIVRAIIELAHMLGMTVVAEGVETAEQWTLLTAFGCDSCQGYFFAPPMSTNDIDSLMWPRVGGSTVRLPARAEAAGRTWSQSGDD